MSGRAAGLTFLAVCVVLAVLLATSGFLPISSSTVFTLLEAASMLVVAAWYYRNCHRYPYAGVVLALVPLFFAWRSICDYFYYADLILLALVLSDKPERGEVRAVPSG